MGIVGAFGNTHRPGRSRGLATGGANQLMPLIRRHDRLDRGNLHHWLTKRRGIVTGLRGVTTAPRLRLEHDDLIDGCYLDEEASRAWVIPLTPTTVLTSWVTWDVATETDYAMEGVKHASSAC
jgi:hypothetical protein